MYICIYNTMYFLNSFVTAMALWQLMHLDARLDRYTLLVLMNQSDLQNSNHLNLADVR